MTHLLDSARPPDAVFCFNDLLALGALHALRKRGVKVPDEIAVIGFDDIEEGQFSEPTLSSISPDKRQIAILAVDALSRRLNRGSAPQAEEFVAPHSLIARQSTIGNAE